MDVDWQALWTWVLQVERGELEPVVTTHSSHSAGPLVKEWTLPQGAGSRWNADWTWALWWRPDGLWRASRQGSSNLGCEPTPTGAILALLLEKDEGL